MAAAPPPCCVPTVWVVMGQHYRHSNPQCEGGMPGSFKLRQDMGADRLQAVEDWLRAEGYAYRFRQKRWRVWTRPDRPGEGLRPDGIEEDENPNEYPSGATINVSIWDMMEKKFPEPGNERTLQGSSSSASPGKEKRSAGDRKRDKKWREYQGSLAAEAAQAAENETKGGTPAPSPGRASGGHQPGHTTLGDFLEVANKAKAKPRQLHLRKSPGDPDGPPEEGDPEATWHWIVLLRRRVQTLEREVDTGKCEMIRIARVAAGAQKELDIAKTEMVKIAKVATAAQRELNIARGETRLLNKVINGLQQRLDELESRGSVGSDHPPPDSGSLDDGWGPGPGPGRDHAPGGAPRSRPSASAPSLSAPSHHGAGRRNERVPPGSGSEEWRDEWLSAEYRNRRAPPRTPVRPRRPAPAQEPMPMAGGHYGGLRDEVPGGDVGWDVGGGEEDLKEFGITPPRMYDGRPLNSAAGAVTRRHTWKEYSMKI